MVKYRERNVLFKGEEGENTQVALTAWAGLISGPRSDLPHSRSNTLARMCNTSRRASRIFVLCSSDGFFV